MPQKKSPHKFSLNVSGTHTLSSSIETGFPGRLYTMAVTDDKKVWMGGKDNILKLFDLQGNIQRTLKIPCSSRLYICVHNGQVVFSDTANKTTFHNVIIF